MTSDAPGNSWLAAEWDAPGWIRAGITTRFGGASAPPYDGLNLATHVGDDPDTVTRNRQYVSEFLGLVSEPLWLNQIHGNRIICAENTTSNTADGAYTDQAGIVCTVMTADCVPVLFCNAAGNRVAAVHVGWKGYCAAIIDKAMQLFIEQGPETCVWIGPHIRSGNYEVGDDVRNACLARDSSLATAFIRNPRGRWQANLEQMIRHDLYKYGVHRIAGTNHCTCTEPGLFYSYRRDGQTGRMASMIWIGQHD